MDNGLDSGEEIEKVAEAVQAYRERKATAPPLASIYPDITDAIEAHTGWLGGENREEEYGKPHGPGNETVSFSEALEMVEEEYLSQVGLPVDARTPPFDVGYDDNSTAQAVNEILKRITPQAERFTKFRAALEQLK